MSPSTKEDQLLVVAEEGGTGLWWWITARGQWSNVGPCGQVESPEIVKISGLKGTSSEDVHGVAMAYSCMRVPSCNSAIALWDSRCI